MLAPANVVQGTISRPNLLLESVTSICKKWLMFDLTALNILALMARLSTAQAKHLRRLFLPVLSSSVRISGLNSRSVASSPLSRSVSDLNVSSHVSMLLNILLSSPSACLPAPLWTSCPAVTRRRLYLPEIKYSAHHSEGGRKKKRNLLWNKHGVEVGQCFS